MIETKEFFRKPSPRCFAHRGFSLHYPENTLLAFEKALDWLPYLEMDLWFSKDGVPVIHHDQKLLRTCGYDGNISDLPFQDIQTLDAGSQFKPEEDFPFRGKNLKVPSLEAVLAHFPEAIFNIEFKSYGPESPKLYASLIPLLKKPAREGRLLLTSFQDASMKLIRETFCQLQPATGSSSEEGLLFAEWIKQGCQTQIQMPGDALQIPLLWQGLALDRVEVIDAAHSLGMEVHYWTINDAKVIEKLWKLGADGIFSDDAKTLAESCSPALKSL